MSPSNGKRGPAGPVPNLFTTTNSSPQISPRDDRHPCSACSGPTIRRVQGRYIHSWCETDDSRDYKWTDVETAQWAAAENRPRRGTQRWLVLEALAARPDATDFELAAHAHLRENSASKRRLELVRLGFAEFAGCYRLAPSGSKAMVWRVTDAGVAYWRAVAS